MTASELFRQKTTLPTDLRTAQLSRLPVQIRQQSFFMAAVMQETILSGFRDAAQAVLDGKLSEAEATRLIREALKSGDYRPAPGQAGTIKDLSTLRRQMVTLGTNIALTRGLASEMKQEQARAAYPAKELYRFAPRKRERPWRDRVWPAAVARRNAENPDLPPLRPDKMIAPLGDPVWPLLSDFGTPHDPLKFGTGMRQRPVKFTVARDLGILPQKTQETHKADRESPDSLRPLRSLRPSPGISSSPGENVVLKAPLNPASKPRLTAKLRGLAEWQGDSIIFTDPNGTRPYAPDALAAVISVLNPDGTENFQSAALREWFALGGDANAIAELQKKHRGKDLLDDFNRLVLRLQRSSPNTDPVSLLTNLATALGWLI